MLARSLMHVSITRNDPAKMGLPQAQTCSCGGIGAQRGFDKFLGEGGRVRGGGWGGVGGGIDSLIGYAMGRRWHHSSAQCPLCVRVVFSLWKPPLCIIQTVNRNTTFIFSSSNIYRFIFVCFSFVMSCFFFPLPTSSFHYWQLTALFPPGGLEW